MRTLKVEPGASLRLDGLVHQWMVRVSDELVPVGAIDFDGKIVGVEAGTRDHGENLAVPRIHGHDRAVAVAQGEFGGALQVVVDGEPEILAGYCVLDAEITHFSPTAVDDHLARAVLAAEQRIVGLLYACFAHHVTRLVVGEARIVQIVLAQLTHVTDQMSGKTITRVKSALLVDGFELRQLITVRRDEGLLVGGDVRLDRNRLIAGLGAIAVQRGAQLIQIKIQAARNQRQIRVHIAALLAYQETRNRRVVVDHKAVLAVEELAARRQDRLFANAVLLG